MKSRNSDGFALPTVLISSIIMLIVMLSAVSSTVAIRVSLNSQYYNRLAQAAGDAGTAYAKACLLRNSNTPTWSTAKPLMPNTDCNGDLLPGFTCGDGNALTEARCSVSIRDKMTTSFIVGSPRVDSGGKAVAVNAAGYTKLYRGSGVSAEPWRQYSGSVLLYTMPKIAITGVGAITGTAQVGQTLTAGAVTPAGATVGYQWQSSTTPNGTYVDIAGATANTYIVSPSRIGKYLKVKLVGTGVYSGTLSSIASAQIPANVNWSIIGTQAWARSNLNTGVMISAATPQTDNSIVEKHCYNNLESNCTTYGGLYQWNEAMNYTSTEGSRGICPAGSHIPSDSDWKTLEIFLGMSQAQADISYAWRGSAEGIILQNGTAGITIPLAGLYAGGSFSSLSQFAYLLTSTQSGADIWSRGLYASYNTIARYPYSKSYGMSVRCLGD